VWSDATASALIDTARALAMADDAPPPPRHFSSNKGLGRVALAACGLGVVFGCHLVLSCFAWLSWASLPVVRLAGHLSPHPGASADGGDASRG
jgi:hypothetical protein